MRARTLAILILVAAAAAKGAAAGPGDGESAAAPIDRRNLADRVFARLSALRAERAVTALVRRPELDRAASAHAREIASRPEGRRLATEESTGALLRRSGVRRFRRAEARVALLRGYEDPAESAVEQWVDTTGPSCLDPRWNAVGVGVDRGPDGVLAFAAVLIEDGPSQVDIREMEVATETAIEDARRRDGLPPLTVSEPLREVARRHSEDMAARRYFGHDSPEGEEPADRIRAAGIAFRKMSENIGKNLGSDDPVRTAVEGWLSSPGHRRNLLDPEVTATGVGIAVGEDGAFFFTQEFLEPITP